MNATQIDASTCTLDDRETKIVSVRCGERREREKNVLATIVGIVVARDTTRLDGVKLKPISDKVLQSWKTVQGPLLVSSPK